MLEKVLPLYGISNTATIQSFGSGLIHNTWKIERSIERIHTSEDQPRSFQRALIHCR